MRRSFTALAVVLLAPLVTSNAHAMTLEEALSSAYSYNPEIKAQQSRLKNTDETINQAYSEFLPDMNYIKNYGRESNQVGSSAKSFDNPDTQTWQIAQPIFQGGRGIALTKRADSLIHAERNNLNDIEQQILLESVTAFIDVLRDEDIAKLSIDNEEVLLKQYEDTKERFALGEVTSTDVAQAEARYERAKTDSARAKGNLAAAQATFHRVIGLEPINLEAPAAYPTMPATLDELTAQALEHNPTLQSTIYQDKAAASDVKINVANALPKVNVIGRARKEESTLSFGGQEIETNSVLLDINVPLYQSGTEYSRIRQAKYAKSQRQFNVQTQRTKVTEQAVQAWQDYQVARATIISTKAAADAAKLALDGVEQELEVGSRTTLDVLDAKQELFQSRVEAVRARRNEIVSMYTILSVMGKITAEQLQLPVNVFKPEEHYKDVRFKFFGWNTD